jgi:hypothetical protein
MICSSVYRFRFIVWSFPVDQTPGRLGSIQGGNVTDSRRGARGQDDPLGRGPDGALSYIFPQMTGCLPEDEGAQLRFDFETEMARLEAA